MKKLIHFKWLGISLPMVFVATLVLGHMTKILYVGILNNYIDIMVFNGI